MKMKRSGGCLCGAVRYEATWPPVATAVCHCKNCQKQAGSALSVIAVLPRDGLSVTGTLTTYVDTAASGNPVYRQFCGTCGSPVISDTPGAEAQGIIFLKAGTLDEARDLEPTLHYWKNSAHDWFVFPEGVACLETQ
jgi:hypothetical protein